MATHDYVIANASGAAVRADLNNALAAIVSNNSNASAPATTYAYQWWADTTAGQLKLRNSANDAWITIQELDGTMLMEDGTAGAPGLAFASDLDTGFLRPGANSVAISTNGAQRLVVDASGQVGISETAPGTLVEIGSTAPYVTLKNSTQEDTSGGRESKVIFEGEQSGGEITSLAEIEVSHEGTADDEKGQLILKVNSGAEGASPGEAIRIDSSGRLLVGTSSGSSEPIAAFQGRATDASDGAMIALTRTGATPSGTIGVIQFATGSDFAKHYASIIATSEGTVSSSSTSGVLRFNTTSTGATSSTERMRIRNDGTVLIGQTNDSFGANGHILNHQGRAFHVATDNTILSLNRLNSDGELVNFTQDNSQEGSITVSGSTVSYNGAHLSRWSQLASNAERVEILRGSVLSNLDEMCEWAHAAQDAVLYTDEDDLPEGVSVGDVKTPAVDAYTEDNEQLNRMKVSDVEEDPNVAGVFQGWDDDDDTYINDFYCAMTGDFVIRIAQGTTVARGDLLMSAGDGTAKPQDDDIVRSKTIAKVTSTTVSETYSDGSYCVPCVLMAC